MTQPRAEHWLATDPPRPCPDVLTAAEAAVYLRLETDSPERTLARYRALGRLKGTQIGKHVRYQRKHLDEFLDCQADSVPR